MPSFTRKGTVALPDIQTGGLGIIMSSTSTGSSWRGSCGNTGDDKPSCRPPVTEAHVKEWSSFGPSLKAKPSSPEQLTALRDRKKQVSEFKQRITKELNADNDPKIGKKKWSTRNIVIELDRQVALRNKKQQGDDFPIYQKYNSHIDNIIDHRPNGGPLLQYLWCNPTSNPLHGQTLYLGGEVGSDGNIYCIPGHAGRVLQISTKTNVIQQIGPELRTNCHSPDTSQGRLFKWLRGIVVGDLIYGLPCHADDILKINVKTQEITTLPIPYEALYDSPEEAKVQRQMIWKYHGGTICPIDNCIYAIPQRAHHVLKIDLTTENVSIVGPAFPGSYKWYGGIVGKQDGAIYGIPQCASGVLRITPADVTVHGDFGIGDHKWHGGAPATNTGVIVSIPANADKILCITPGETPKLELIGNESFIQSGRHRTDGKYKYLGAMASNVSGKVYLFPCASEYVLQVDTLLMKAKNVGPNLRDSKMEEVHQNKWQNGLTCEADGCVYGMPLSSHTLLRIDCNATSAETEEDPIITTWKLPSPKIECRDKFEGGTLTASGVMYTVPNNHKGVLRIEPANMP